MIQINFFVNYRRDTTVKVWSATTNEELKSLGGHTASVTCVKFRTDKSYETFPSAVSGSYDCSVRVWDVDNRKLVEHVQAPLKLEVKMNDA